MKCLGQKPANGVEIGQPFGSTVSANYRIPGLVWHQGMLVASADVRWDLEKDGGGMDLVVSRSKDGKAWQYTFPGYLGDNGNVWNPDSSTLMDPVIISNGSRLYLIADLFPAGYSISETSTTHVIEDMGPAFSSDGALLLSGDGGGTYGYCLRGENICTLDGERTGLHVRGWYDLYNDAGTYVSNLFFAGAPYRPRPASYICMTVSDDGGETWSDPMLLNLKNEGTRWLILGPGSGLVTQDGYLAFTAYDGIHIYLIFGKDSNWRKVKTAAASGESSIVELRDGTIRAFVRRMGCNRIAYVDFLKTAAGYEAGELVETGVENFSNCMISSLRCSNTWDGREVVLVCCPSDAGGGMWAGRFRGELCAFALDEKNSMELIGTHQLNEGFFAYSNMAQLPDGTLGLLYEDDCISYRAGNYEGKASHITYTNVNLEKTFGILLDKPEI